MKLLNSILIGIGAGIAAGLLMAGMLTGSPISLILVVITPLPIAIAVFGFGVPAGIAAVLSGAAAVVATSYLITRSLDFASMEVFLASFGVPTAVVAYFAGIPGPRKAGEDTPRWYSLDLVLSILGLAAAAGSLARDFLIHEDPSTITASLIEAMRETQLGQRASLEEIQQAAKFYTLLMPYLEPASLIVMLLFSLWAGARIAAFSGLLARPWTPLWTARQHPWIAVVLVAAVVVSALGGQVGLIAAAVAGGAGGALALAGLAAVHAMTAQRSARVPTLTLTYIITLLPLVGGVLAALLGLADTFLDLRARFGGKPTT